MLADLLRFVVVNNVNFCLILIKPSKSDIFCDNYYQESMDHSMPSDYPINKLFSFNIHSCGLV